MTVAVGGPPTVGKTEVAIAMAGLLASDRVLLVDVADTYPSIAPRLSSGVASALALSIR